MLQHTTKKQRRGRTLTMAAVKVAIFDFDGKVSKQLAEYFNSQFNATVEWDNGSDVGSFIAEMSRFKPVLFVVSQLCATPLKSEPDPTMTDLHAHCAASRVIISKFERRPYLAAIANTISIGHKLYRRYRACCEEHGYDSVVARNDVNSKTIGEWVSAARKRS